MLFINFSWKSVVMVRKRWKARRLATALNLLNGISLTVFICKTSELFPIKLSAVASFTLKLELSPLVMSPIYNTVSLNKYPIC